MTVPRIYVASLSDYNAGRLVGRWIDLDDDINSKIQAMLDESIHLPAEEWAIHDYEGFGGYRVSEYESIDDLQALGEWLDEWSWAQEAKLAYLENVGDITTAIDEFEDAYRGEFDSPADFAYHWYEDTGQLDHDSELSNYIDWEDVARGEFEINGGFYFIPSASGGVYVFAPV